MDDNELDRLFGKDGETDKEAPEKTAQIPENEPEKKDAEESAPSGDDVTESPFVISDKDESEGKEDKTEESEDEAEDPEKDTEKDENQEEADGSEDSGDTEAARSGEDTEDPEEKEAEESGKSTQEKDSALKIEKRVRPKKQKKPEPDNNQLKDVIPLNGKSIAVIIMALAIVIMVVLIMFLPAFRVRNVHVEGNVVLTDQEILEAAGFEYDAHLMSGVSGNIFDIIRLDYGKTEERIKKENPYVEDIRITIKLPSTVDIQIKERSKVCYVRTPDGYAALDKDGIVLELSSFDSGRTVQPVICGLNVTYAELGKPVKISNMNDFKKAIIVLGAILAADNASVGGDYCMFENTSEVRILPSGYIFLTIYSPSGNLIQIKLNGTDTISDDMAWLLYAFNADAFDKVTVDGALDMTGDEYTFREY